MFNKTKIRIKSYFAAGFAMAMLMVNSVPVLAAPYGYDSNDDVRAKALEDYIAGNAYIVAMTQTAPAVIDAVKQTASAEIVTYKEITQSEKIPFNTVKRLNKELEAGKTVTVREGEDGTKVKVIKVKYVNGAEVSRETVNEYTEEAPVDKIVEYGNKVVEKNKPITASSLNYKYVIECTATAYDLSPEENGGYGGQTATGVPLDKGVIAVDPKVIPLGSRVYIEALDGSWSYGYAVAADTGGAIKGKKVDLCYRTRQECIQFGRRKCRVYVL